MQGVRWQAVLAGAVVISILFLLYSVASLHLPSIAGAILSSGESQPRKVTVVESGIGVFAPVSLVAAFVMPVAGGFVAGYTSSSNPGKNGFLAVSVSALLAIAYLSPSVFHILGQTDPQIRSENLGLVTGGILLLTPLLLVALGGGFWGGRIGGLSRAARNPGRNA